MRPTARRRLLITQLVLIPALQGCDRTTSEPLQSEVVEYIYSRTIQHSDFDGVTPADSVGILHQGFVVLGPATKQIDLRVMYLGPDRTYYSTSASDYEIGVQRYSSGVAGVDSIRLDVGEWEDGIPWLVPQVIAGTVSRTEMHLAIQMKRRANQPGLDTIRARFQFQPNSHEEKRTR